MPEEKVVHTICNSHCGGTCVLRLHVRDNKVVRIEADDGDGARPCARGRAYRQRIYAPDRLLYPLRRTGTRGAGEFTRISWDEALDTVARQLNHVKETHGNCSILFFCSMADQFVLHHVRTFHRLLCQFGGYTSPWGAISNEGENFSSGVTYGNAYGVGHTPAEYLQARLVILWSWNPATTDQGNTPWYLARAREEGTRIICVDPRYTDSAAALAERWIPIRPGTDAAALLAMANVIIKENLCDKGFIDSYTFGFDKFKKYVFGIEDGVEKTPAWAEAITGVPAEMLASLARDYASIKPALLGAGRAAGRSALGEQYHRAAAALEAITGNICVPGPSSGQRDSKLRALYQAAQVPSPPNQVEMNAPPRWNALPFRGASVNSSARVNISRLADAIIQGKAGGYPHDYKFLWLSNTNYLNQLGDVNKMAKAMRKLDFVLVTEQFMTPTAKFADIVLPVCTAMERNDFYASGNGELYGLVNKAIEPLGESKSQLQICEALASKLGINDFNDKSDEEWVKSVVAKLSEQTDFPDYDALKKKGMYKATSNKPKEIRKAEQKPFNTPSGKIEIYSQIVAKMNHPQIPPIPKYLDNWESPNDPLIQKYPLQLITSHFKWRAHSQFHNLPWLRELQSQTVTMNTIDAEARGIHEGDMVNVFNDRGEVMIPVHVTERIMPGVVDLKEGAWYEPDERGKDHGGCCNVLTSNEISPAGAFACNTALVQVTKQTVEKEVQDSSCRGSGGVPQPRKSPKNGGF